MLDENLPTFLFRRSDNPLSSVVFFTQNGSEPAPEYAFRKPNPALLKSKNRYAIALGDAHSEDVIFAEVLIEPEWQQASLSAAEIRQQNGVSLPPVPLIPDGFTVQLYNPDQQVAVRGEKSTWTGKESWEFEMPSQSFRVPSSSKLDRQQSDPTARDLAPKIMFRWKRDSKFSKNMTCYLCGKSMGGKKSKEPDITVGLYKQGKEPTVTIYEPNLSRVEVEDRKGLEVVLLLGAEVIREIYLFPSRDVFNISGNPAKRKNSKLAPGSSPSPTPNPHLMTSALGNRPPATATASSVSKESTPPNDARTQWEIEAETRRLQALVEKEERERERRDKTEQKRIKKMLEDEERERARQDAAVARETERLRRQYGVQGQDFGPLPSRPLAGPANGGRPPTSQPQLSWNAPYTHPTLPPRPLSASPPSQGGLFSNFWHGPTTASVQNPGASYPHYHHGNSRRRGVSADAGRKALFE